jgi:hypothetical protein
MLRAVEGGLTGKCLRLVAFRAAVVDVVFLVVVLAVLAFAGVFFATGFFFAAAVSAVAGFVSVASAAPAANAFPTSPLPDKVRQINNAALRIIFPLSCIPSRSNQWPELTTARFALPNSQSPLL